MNTQSSKSKTRFQATLLTAVVSLALSLGFHSTLLAQETQNPNAELTERLTNLRDQMNSVAESIETKLPEEALLETQRAISDELRLLVGQFSAGEQAGSQDAVPQQTPGSTRSGSTQGSGMAAADPADDDNQPAGEASNEPGDAELIQKAWGKMPGELQKERGSDLSPRFLPKFERLIREYYRRMSR